MLPKVLHVLSQRPSRTGSGITLDAVVRLAQETGWRQAAVVGIPASDHEAEVGLLDPSDIYPLLFRDEKPSQHPAHLNFPLPGMSDVMPYPSTVWSSLSPENIQLYQQVWTQHLKKVIQHFQPDLIHCNHIWLVSALMKDVAPNIPVVTTCHATGLRQLELCPHLAADVISGCKRNDHFFVLRRDHAASLAKTLNIPHHQISVSGVGFRHEIFHTEGTEKFSSRQDLLYVGKFSNAKGLPWLLDAFTALKAQQPDLCLHIAGDGSGPEAEALRARMKAMSPGVTMHGMLNQAELARLMRRCRVCVLPSFYEGVPLVLVEAAACGCRLVSTRLPGVLEQIAPALGPSLTMIPLPRLQNVDIPVAEDLPQFIRDLTSAMQDSLQAGESPDPYLESFTWRAVFTRIESKWQDLSL